MTRLELTRAVAGASSVSVRLGGRVVGQVIVDGPMVDPASGALRGAASGLVLEAGTLRPARCCALLPADVTRVDHLTTKEPKER